MSPLEEYIRNIKDMDMDIQLHQHLPVLLELAHDRSEAGRLSLAEKLADIFLNQSAALTAREETLVNELIEELVHNENACVREALLARFESAVNAPRPLALRIIGGPIEIARPVLVANENLEDDDLVTLVRTKGARHAAVIAERKHVSEAVADALVMTGDLRIMQIVAENMGAKLSAGALDAMVEAARLAAMLQKPLLSRPELGPDAALKLYWWVARDLRRATLERFGFGPGKLDAYLKKAIEEKLDAHLLQKDDVAAMETLADWLAERDALDIHLLPQLLRAGHYALFKLLLARLGKIESALVDLMTCAAGSRYLALLCRAVGMDKGSFVSIFLMSRGGRADEQIVHPHELTEALAAYDRIDVPTAQAMIDLWRVNPDDLRGRIEAAR